MSAPLKICTVSGGRADYGLLAPVMRALAADPAFRLQLVVTGQHLVDGGRNVEALAARDGLTIAAVVDMRMEGDAPAAVGAAAGRGLSGMSEALDRLRPDLVLVLGDRYEIACAAIAATIARIPLAHIAGGDITEGAFDDAFRHAITKMAHLHFVTNPEAARRVRQMGEQAEAVHVVGSPGLDLIRMTPVMGRDAFFASVDLAPRDVNLLITFHPVTLAEDSLAQLEEMLSALSGLDAGLIFTGANADPDGRRIDARIRDFVAAHPAARFVEQLGSQRYFSALAHVDAMVGNSSSGLYEAPSFGLPAVNIGERQKGRLRAESVIDCPPDAQAIRAAIAAALARGRQATASPYGDGHAAERIVAVLKTIGDPRALLAKHFADLEAA